MRAVCTRSGRRGWGVYAHTRGLCRSEGVELSLLFSPRDDGKNTSWREEALLFRREDPFRPSANPSFVSFRLPFFFFFQTDHPLFWTAPPHRKGVETTGERNRSSFAEILSQTRYYFSLLSCVQFCSVLLRLRSLRGRLTGIYLRFVCIHAI